MLGLFWQYRLFTEDDNDWLRVFNFYNLFWLKYTPLRVKIASIIGSVITLGTIGYTIITLFDPEKHFPNEASLLFGAIGKAILVSMFLIFKSYFGPMFTMFVLSSGIYFGFEYGELRYIPILSGMFDWLFSNTPGFFKMSYLIGSTVYISLSSLYDTFNN